jgi:hypothetical protein
VGQVGDCAGSETLLWTIEHLDMGCDICCERRCDRERGRVDYCFRIRVANLGGEVGLRIR